MKEIAPIEVGDQDIVELAWAREPRLRRILANFGVGGGPPTPKHFALRRIGNLHQLLADVLPGEETAERLRRPVESLDDVDPGSNLAGGGPARELADRFPKARGEAEDQEAPHGRADHILHVTGRPNEARDFGEKARAVGKTLGNLSVAVGGTFYKGAACYFAGDYEATLDLLRETVESLGGDLGRNGYGLVGLPAVMARAYLTWIHTERGEFEAALAHGHDGVRLAEAVDRPYSLIIACWGLVYLHATRQELDQTAHFGDRALALARAWDLPLPSAITAGTWGTRTSSAVELSRVWRPLARRLVSCRGVFARRAC